MAERTREGGWRSIGVGQLLAIAGALSLSTIAHDLIAWRGFIADIVAGWSALVRPTIDFLFGWIFHYFQIPLPEIGKDAMAFYLIMAGSHFRFSLFVRSQYYYEGSTIAERLSKIPLPILFLRSFVWPVFIWDDWYWTIDDAIWFDFTDADFVAFLVLSSTFIYFFVLLGVNYGLLRAVAG